MSEYEEKPRSEPEIVPIDGGYTIAEKSIIKADLEPKEWIFRKQANLVEHPEEQKILANEARMYGLIHQIPQVSKYFPELLAYKDDGIIAQLDIQYLPDVTWGGPFNEHNLNLLASGLHDIHSAPLDPSMIDAIKKPAQELLAHVFSSSEYAFDEEQKVRNFQKLLDKENGCVRNSRGKAYFDNIEVAEDILQTSQRFDESDGDSIKIQDLNFGNLAFNDQLHIVDPVYVNIGNPASDDATVGLNILRSLAMNGGDDQDKLAELTRNLFLSNKEAFAYVLAYCMACTSLPYRGETDPWMDLHQELAEVGLASWQEMHT